MNVGIIYGQSTIGYTDLTSICFECSTYFSSVIYVYYTLFVFYSRSQGNTERKNGLKLK